MQEGCNRIKSPRPQNIKNIFLHLAKYEKLVHTSSSCRCSSSVQFNLFHENMCKSSNELVCTMNN